MYIINGRTSTGFAVFFHPTYNWWTLPGRWASIGSQEGKKPDEALKIGMALQTKAGRQGVGGRSQGEPKRGPSKHKYGA